MRFSASVCAMLWLTLTVAANVAAETYEECLNRVTNETKQKLVDMCWSRAEGPNGVISDNSQANQDAESCERDLNKSFAMDDSSLSQCAHLAVIPVSPEEDETSKRMNDPTPTPKPKPSVRSFTAKTSVVKTAPKKATPSTSGSSTHPQSADIAQDNANMDLDACTTTRNQASQCCNNPLSCASSLSAQDQMSLRELMQQTNNGPAQGQSIADYCNQMQQASASSGSVNNGLSAVCYSNQSSCTSTCSSLMQKYQALVENCGDCDAASVYSSTLANLQSSLGNCQNLQANVNAMARQGVGSANGQAMGSICNQQASFNPQSANNGGGSPPVSQVATTVSDTYGCQQNPQSLACQTCAMNPQSPACQMAQRANPMGKAGFQAASKGNTDFNPTDYSLAQAQAKMNMATASAPSLANQNHAALVPNNSGGAIPGQQDAQQMQANLQAGSTLPAAVQAASTDIMQGYRSGGYSQQGNGSGFESMSGNTQMRKLANAEAPVKLGMDLKKYLLGQKLGPRLVNGLSDHGNQFHGKSVDLFERISIVIRQRCKFDFLRDCELGNR